MIRYVDTSAALKLLIDEPESSSLARQLDASAKRGDQLVSSMLLFTELHCAAQPRTQFDVAGVNAVLDGLTLVDLERSDLLRAGTSWWRLRSADAIHLAVALRIEADELVAYDAELGAAAVQAGLRLSTPGLGGRHA